MLPHYVIHLFFAGTTNRTAETAYPHQLHNDASEMPVMPTATEAMARALVTDAWQTVRYIPGVGAASALPPPHASPAFSHVPSWWGRWFDRASAILFNAGYTTRIHHTICYFINELARYLDRDSHFTATLNLYGFSRGASAALEFWSICQRLARDDHALQYFLHRYAGQCSVQARRNFLSSRAGRHRLRCYLSQADGLMRCNVVAIDPVMNDVGWFLKRLMLGQAGRVDVAPLQDVLLVYATRESNLLLEALSPDYIQGRPGLDFQAVAQLRQVFIPTSHTMLEHPPFSRYILAVTRQFLREHESRFIQTRCQRLILWGNPNERAFGEVTEQEQRQFDRVQHWVQADFPLQGTPWVQPLLTMFDKAVVDRSKVEDISHIKASSLKWMRQQKPKSDVFFRRTGLTQVDTRYWVLAVRHMLSFSLAFAVMLHLMPWQLGAGLGSLTVIMILALAIHGLLMAIRAVPQQPGSPLTAPQRVGHPSQMTYANGSKSRPSAPMPAMRPSLSTF